MGKSQGAILFIVSVFSFPQQGMPGPCHVGADLMGAPGFQMNLQEGKILLPIIGKGAIAGDDPFDARYGGGNNRYSFGPGIFEKISVQYGVLGIWPAVNGAKISFV